MIKNEGSHGTLLNVMGQPEWKLSLGSHGRMAVDQLLQENVLQGTSLNIFVTEVLKYFLPFCKCDGYNISFLKIRE